MNKKVLLCGVFSTALMFGFNAMAQPTVSTAATTEKAVVTTTKDAAKHMKKKGDRPDFERKMQEKLAKKLDLTPEQQELAKKLNENSRKKIEPLMDEMRKTREEMDKIRRDNMAEFEKILTPEQKTKFDNMKKEQHEQFEKHHKKMMKDRKGKDHRMMPPRGEMMPHHDDAGMMPPPPFEPHDAPEK